VILTSLVYEKQERLRIIMKMHGLGIGPYWMISYAYFLTLSMFYVISLVIFGSAIGLRYFRLNDYSVQFIFYFIFVNLQISFAFLASSIFSKVKTATGTNITFLESSHEYVIYQRLHDKKKSAYNCSCCLYIGVCKWALGNVSLW